MTGEVLIALNTPEQPVEFMPPVTHMKLVRVDYEVSRPNDTKEGYLNLWYAKGFFVNGVFREAPGVAGVNLLLGFNGFTLLEQDLLNMLIAISDCTAPMVEGIVVTE